MPLKHSLLLIACVTSSAAHADDFQPLLTLRFRISPEAVDYLGPATTALTDAVRLRSRLLEGIADLDQSRPSVIFVDPVEGATSWSAGASYRIGGIVACKNVRESVDEADSATDVPEKIGDNLYRRGEAGRERYIQIEGELAFVATSRELIPMLRQMAAEPVSPSDAVEGASLVVHWNAAPPSMRAQMLEAVHRLDRSLGQRRDRDALFMRLFVDAATQILANCETFRVDLGIAPADGSLRFDARLNAQRDSVLSKSLRSLSMGGSRYVEQLDPQADLNVAVALQLPDTVKEITRFLNVEFTAPDVVKLMGDQERFSKVRAAYEDAAAATDIVRNVTVGVGRLDTVCSVKRFNAPPLAWGTVFAPGAENIEPPLATFLAGFHEVLPESPVAPAVDRHGDVPIHRLDRNFCCALEKNTAHFALGPPEECLIEHAFHEETTPDPDAPALLIDGRMLLLPSLLSLHRRYPAAAEYLRRNPLDGRFHLAVRLESDAAQLSLSVDEAAYSNAIERGFKMMLEQAKAKKDTAPSSSDSP